MKTLVLRCSLLGIALLTSLSSTAQSQCNNQDFDDSTFVGWTGATGTNMNGVLLPVAWTNGLISNGNNAAIADINARHTIITQNFLNSFAIDPATMLPDTQMTSLAPGGGIASIRLGNSNMNYECEKVAFPFTVSANNPSFQFQYSSVMEDPGHMWNEQPYFMVNFYDQSGNPIVACNDTIWAGDTTVPYIHSGSNFYILYRRWTPLSKDLSAYVGQQVTVEFVNSDCMYGGHYGYTNIDVSCIGSAIANVWPGDCDYDLQANNVDFLTLGIAFGTNGPVRSAATNNWNAQASSDWPQAIPLGANYKHSDCNGDGTVDLNDTLAITLNYTQTHPFRAADPGSEVGVQSNSMIYLVPVNDTVSPLGTIDVDIYAGTTAQPLNDFYGTAFTLTYNNLMVVPSSVGADFSGSWLGVKNASMITLGHDNPSIGENDIAITRINQTEVNGYGYIGTMHLTAENLTTLSVLEIGVSNLMTVNADGTVIPLATAGCQVVIDPAFVSGITNTTPENHVSLYPNPANDLLVVSTTAAQTIEITDAIGRVVSAVPATGNTTKIDVSTLAPGIYFVNAYSQSGMNTQRLIVE